MPTVSIVLPTYNRLLTLQQTLRTLCALDYPHDRYEIIVVNDASTDGTAEWLAAHCHVCVEVAFRPLTVSKCGSGTARNFGVHHARGEYIFFTDDDCIIEKDCLRELVEAMARERCDALAGRIRCQESPGVISRYCTSIRFNVIADDPTELPPFVNTANGFFPRRLLIDVGGFDENFPYLGCVDKELSQRMLNFGYVFKPCSTAVVLHRNKTTLRALHRAFYNQSRGAAYIHAKNYPDKRAAFLLEHCLKLLLNFIRCLLIPAYIVWNLLVKRMSLIDACCFPLLARTTKIASMWGRIIGRIRFWDAPQERHELLLSSPAQPICGEGVSGF